MFCAIGGTAARQIVRPTARDSAPIAGRTARGTPTAQVSGVDVPDPTRRSDDLVVRICASAGSSPSAKLGLTTPAGGSSPKAGSGGTQYRSANGRWVLHEVDPTTSDKE